MRSSHNGYTIVVVEDSRCRANSKMPCASLSGKRRCHLVGICSAFLGLPGVGLVKAGHTWVVFGSASRDFFALEVTLSPHYSALVVPFRTHDSQFCQVIWHPVCSVQVAVEPSDP